MYSLLSCQPASLPVYLAAIGLSCAGLAVLGPACWLTALFTGVGLSRCSALTFTLIYVFLHEACFPAILLLSSCAHSTFELACSCTSHTPPNISRATLCPPPTSRWINKCIICSRCVRAPCYCKALAVARRLDDKHTLVQSKITG